MVFLHQQNNNSSFFWFLIQQHYFSNNGSCSYNITLTINNITDTVIRPWYKSEVKSPQPWFRRNTEVIQQKDNKYKERKSKIKQWFNKWRENGRTFTCLNGASGLKSSILSMVLMSTLPRAICSPRSSPTLLQTGSLRNVYISDNSLRTLNARRLVCVENRK